MQRSRTEKAIAITGMILAICGFAYLFVDDDSLIVPILITAGAGLSVLAAWKNPDFWKLVRSDSRLDIGDLLLLAAVLTGLAVSNFLTLPTKEDRGIALLGPALLFVAGIIWKVSHFFRRFGRNSRIRKP